MPRELLDFSHIDVRNAEAARRKLGVVGLVDTEAEVSVASLALSRPLPAASGGTGTGTNQPGDLLVGSRSAEWDRLPAGPENTWLRSDGPGQSPAWKPIVLTIGMLAGIVPPDFFGRMVINNGLTVSTAGGAPIFA